MTKRLLILSAVALFLSASARAYDFEAVNDEGVTMYYNILSDSEASVTYGGTSYNSALYSGAVVIPETVIYNGTTYSVTEVGYSAFSECTGLTSVTIPESVTTIGAFVFERCSGLTEITIPNSVTTIGDNAFHYCSGLTSVTISNSVTSIGNSAFYECTGLTKFEVSEGNEYYCSVDGVLYSKDMTVLVAFPCDSPLLPSFDIPESVTEIGSEAFNYCSKLTSVTIPNSVTEIGNGAFEGCI